MRKMIQIQACFCDNCKREIKTDKRMFIKFGSGNWNDDKADKVNTTMEVCETCYNDILSIIGDVAKEIPTKSNADTNEEDRVANLYKRKISYDEICKITGLSKNRVVYIINKLRSQGVRRDDFANEQAMNRQKIMENKPILRTVVDKNGFVVN